MPSFILNITNNSQLMKYCIQPNQGNIDSFYLALMGLKPVSDVDTLICQNTSAIEEIRDDRFGRIAIRTKAGESYMQISRSAKALREFEQIENSYSEKDESIFYWNMGLIYGYPETAISEFVRLMAAKEPPGFLFNFNASEKRISIKPAVCRAVFVPTLRDDKVVEASLLEGWRQAVNAEVGPELGFLLDLSAKKVHFFRTREAYRCFKEPYAEKPCPIPNR